MASASSTTKKFDVFLNFRGADTRNGFTSSLYDALCFVDINTFIDAKLERGQEISQALLQTIKNAKLSVVVFSQNYAFSPYCLDELVEIIQCKKSECKDPECKDSECKESQCKESECKDSQCKDPECKDSECKESQCKESECKEPQCKESECKEPKGQVVFPIFYKVDPEDIEKMRGTYEKAFAEHEAKFKDEKEKLEKWKSALQEAVRLSGYVIKNDQNEAQEITKIIKNISERLNEENKVTLKRKLQELQTMETNISSRLDEADEFLIPEVKIWLKHVERMKNTVQSVHTELKKSEWSIRLQFEIEQSIKNMVELIDQKAKIETALRDSHPTHAKLLPTKSLVGLNFQEDAALIMEWLSRSDVSSIGIYGMAGVGKTALATHIYNKLLENPPKFANVYRVTVSQDVSVHKLQSLIAQTIKVKLGSEEDERKRAAILSNKLNERKKFVLILDDVWNHFDVEDIGVPIGSNGCKLIVISRSRDVCRRTNCGMIQKVGPLNDEEAWELFVKTIEFEIPLGAWNIAKSIVMKCGGLPLAIITMAKSMKGVDNLREWEIALADMRSGISTQQDMRDGVFITLKQSYIHLNDPTLQQCLLYCALFPEHYWISSRQLINLLIFEGIIDQDRSTAREKTDKGLIMLEKLANASLLEQDDNMVKMHSLVRDMAIQIMTERQPSIVEPGKRLQSLPKENSWRKDIVRVSLMKNDICEIPHNFSPPCPSLTTLLLSENWRLQYIPDSFFDHLKGLKVLDISNTNIQELPESFSQLKSLTALFAFKSFLRYIPHLACLKCMEMLNLRHCDEIQVVPRGLKFLTNLTHLELRRTRILEFPTGILPELLYLQFLAFDKASSNAREIGSLRRLETLIWCFPRMKDLHIIRSLLPMDEIIHTLGVGRNIFSFDINSNGLSSPTREIILNGCIVSPELWELNFPVDTLLLARVSLTDGSILRLKNPIGLRTLVIDGCDWKSCVFGLDTSPSIFRRLKFLYVYNMVHLECLFDFEINFSGYMCLKELHIVNCSVEVLLLHCFLSNLRNLEEISVRDCRFLREIIEVEPSIEEEEEDLVSFPLCLPKLRKLDLFNLPQLRRICSERVECDFLESLRISYCENLRNIPIPLPLPFLRTIVVSPRWWWDTMKWDWENKKYALARTSANRWTFDDEELHE